MAHPSLFIFKRFTVDERTRKLVYRKSTNDLLCEVQIGCNENVPVFISEEVLISNGILNLKYYEDLSTMANNMNKSISTLGSKKKSKKRVKPQKEVKQAIEYIWSTRFTTCEDNAATVYLIQIVNSLSFSQLSLIEPASKSYTTFWEMIYFEMKKAGFEVAASIAEGGIICCEMWKYLKSEFFYIEEIESDEDIWGPTF